MYQKKKIILPYSALHRIKKTARELNPLESVIQ